MKQEQQGQNGALRDAIYKKDPHAIQPALDAGADPYLRDARNFSKHPALYQILEMSSLYHNKIDYARPLLAAGGDFDLMRKNVNHIGKSNWLDIRVLRLGDLSYRDGDAECAGFILAHMIAHDLEKERPIKLPVDDALAGTGNPFKQDANDIGEQSRKGAAGAMTRNQHALVDYVATSNDTVASYLRACADYPDAATWMVKIDPINPDNHSRPTQAFINNVQEFGRAVHDMTEHHNNPEMMSVLINDANLLKKAGDAITKSWKPPVPGSR